MASISSSHAAEASSVTAAVRRGDVVRQVRKAPVTDTHVRDGERKTWNCALLLLCRTMRFIISRRPRSRQRRCPSLLLVESKSDGDVSSTPTPAGLTPRTMISDPVVVTLGGSGAVVSDSAAAPASEQAGTEPAGANGKSKPSTGAGKSARSRSRVDGTAGQSEYQCRHWRLRSTSCGRGGANEFACVI